jgi:hypothetical protein
LQSFSKDVIIGVGTKMEKPLNDTDITKLRDQGLLSNDETALMVGDVVIAENVISKQRRVLDCNGLLLESTRRILKG